ncbi:hypothetical protein PIB30_081399 [Stylosanthes scabra]|uniref:Uncharacterized protein n=1 Tax=Stylosanthes scabra TaxID=79078 RepID=A0ABU6ZQG0_9FABA|nr:hypothetical protein [Stylosanthes scabra]
MDIPTHDATIPEPDPKPEPEPIMPSGLGGVIFTEGAITGLAFFWRNVNGRSASRLETLKETAPHALMRDPL